MANSPELQAINECAEDLEAAFLQGMEEKFVSFLFQDGFLSKMCYNRLKSADVVSAEEAEELVDVIKKEIKHESMLYTIFIYRLKESYAGVAEKLEEVHFQRVLQCTSSKQSSSRRASQSTRGSQRDEIPTNEQERSNSDGKLIVQYN